MARSFDTQITRLNESPYWSEGNFAEAELRVVTHPYTVVEGSRTLIAFNADDVIFVAKADDGPFNGRVQVLTRCGVFDVSRTFVIQYTKPHDS